MAFLALSRHVASRNRVIVAVSLCKSCACPSPIQITFSAVPSNIILLTAKGFSSTATRAPSPQHSILTTAIAQLLQRLLMANDLGGTIEPDNGLQSSEAKNTIIIRSPRRDQSSVMLVSPSRIQGLVLERMILVSTNQRTFPWCSHGRHSICSVVCEPSIVTYVYILCGNIN